jgi:hypothetical protein
VRRAFRDFFAGIWMLEHQGAQKTALITAVSSRKEASDRCDVLEHGPIWCETKSPPSPLPSPPRRGRIVANLFAKLQFICRWNPRQSVCEAAVEGQGESSPVALRRVGSWRALLFLFCVVVAPVFAEQPIGEERGSFRAVDIYVDSKQVPLAAYQLKFSVTNANAKIVGIEGGEHPAFREPPLYDPTAVQHERVIIASFNTAPKDELPKGKTRVATIHLQTTGDDSLKCVLKVQAAANPEGTKIAVQATWEERRNK